MGQKLIKLYTLHMKNLLNVIDTSVKPKKCIKHRRTDRVKIDRLYNW